jgi:L-glyceraldehyde 3-phosphate reductase
MAIAWLLRSPVITSVLIGVSSAEQLKDNIGAIGNIVFTEENLRQLRKSLSNNSEMRKYNWELSVREALQPNLRAT